MNVAILNEIVRYLDDNGKPITISLKDYTRNKILERYESLDDFLTKWDKSYKKQAIIEELSKQGILFEHLKESINKEMDIFDMICHVAFGQSPLTRTERANNVKKRDYFTKYGEQARKVLEALLDKYADEGIENIEDINILRVNPLDKFGTLIEIIDLFGGKNKYFNALSELEQEIYRRVA